MTKMLSASGGFAPPNQGLCPWTLLGALPPDPIIGSCSALAMVPPQPLTPSAAYDCPTELCTRYLKPEVGAYACKERKKMRWHFSKQR